MFVFVCVGGGNLMNPKPLTLKPQDLPTLSYRHRWNTVIVCRIERIMGTPRRVHTALTIPETISVRASRILVFLQPSKLQTHLQAIPIETDIFDVHPATPLFRQEGADHAPALSVAQGAC